MYRSLGAPFSAHSEVVVSASIDEAVDQMVQIEGTFTPNKENRAMYEEHHALYQGIYEAIANAGPVGSRQFLVEIFCLDPTQVTTQENNANTGNERMEHIGF